MSAEDPARFVPKPFHEAMFIQIPQAEAVARPFDGHDHGTIIATFAEEDVSGIDLLRIAICQLDCPPFRPDSSA